MIRKLLFIVLLLGITIPIQAQKIWTLEECIAHALTNNLQLRDLDLTAQATEETYRQSVRNLLPVVNASADYSVNFGRSINPEDNSFVNTEFFSNSYNIQSSLDLFQGFQKINNLKASKFLSKAAKEDWQQQKYLLGFRIMSAYYDIQFIQGLITISQEQADISKTNYDLVARQVELGIMAGADLYEAESLLLADELTLTQNKNRLQAAKLTLLQAMNIEGEQDIIIATEVNEMDKINRKLEIHSDSIFKKAKGFMPSLKAQEYRVASAKKQVQTARANLFPSLRLFGGIGTGYFETIRDTLGKTISFKDQFRDNTFRFIGGSINIPVFSAWAHRSRIKQQKIALERAKNNAQITEQELYQIIQQLVQENEALLVETSQTAKQMESQRLAFNIAQKRYEKGMINAIALGQAKNLFATAQNRNLQAKLRMRVNKSTLDFYRGLPLFNIN